MTRGIPEGFHSVTPLAVFKDAGKAIDFYKNAFGAEVLFTMPGPDGKGIMHAELRIGNSILMMGEEHPQMECRSAETAGGSPVAFYLYVENADRAFSRAVEAGAQVRRPVEEMFWGDRVGDVVDPFGYAWSLATRVRDLTPQEMAEGAKAFFARMAKR